MSIQSEEFFAIQHALDRLGVMARNDLQERYTVQRIADDEKYQEPFLLELTLLGKRAEALLELRKKFSSSTAKPSCELKKILAGTERPAGPGCG